MSKRKKNYPDPMDIVNKYGADAIRLYLINSPVVRAENLRFKEEGVRDVVKDVFLPWFNAYRFLIQNIDRHQNESGISFLYNENKVAPSDNYMDRWILSFTQSLIKFVKEEMAAYRLYTVVPRLVKFVEQLTNWYVRMNRRRFKGEGGSKDCQIALEMLFGVLFSMTKVMAPFVPYLTEYMYQNLKVLIDPESMEVENMDSIHYLMLPMHKESLIDSKIELSVSRMQSVIELGRVVRDRNTMPMKYPLKEVVIIHKDQDCLRDVLSMETYILEELNVRRVTVSSDKKKYNVRLQASLDFKTLGAKLKGDMKNVMAVTKGMTDEQLTEFQKSGTMTVCGHELSRDEVKLKYAFDSDVKSTSVQYDADSDGEILILLDVTPDPSMIDEGLAREIMNRVQKLRKKAKLSPSDPITIYYRAPNHLSNICRDYSEFIYATLKQPLRPYPVKDSVQVIISEKTKIKNDEIEVTLVKDHVDGSGKDVESSSMSSSGNGPSPVCRYVNVKLCAMRPGGGATGTQATILLENPKGDFPISVDELRKQVQVIFGLCRPTKLYLSKDQKNEVTSSSTTNIFALHGHVLYAHPN